MAVRNTYFPAVGEALQGRLRWLSAAVVPVAEGWQRSWLAGGSSAGRLLAGGCRLDWREAAAVYCLTYWWDPGPGPGPGHKFPRRASRGCCQFGT